MAKTSSQRRTALPGQWVLQDAKARFSELVRRVHSEGPQHVTVHGRDEVVVIAAKEFRRLQGERTGQALIDALQALRQQLQNAGNRIQRDIAEYAELSGQIMQLTTIISDSVKKLPRGTHR